MARPKKCHGKLQSYRRKAAPYALGVHRTVPMIGLRRLASLHGGLSALLVVVADGKQKRVVVGVEEVEKPTGHIAVNVVL